MCMDIMTTTEKKKKTYPREEHFRKKKTSTISVFYSNSFFSQIKTEVLSFNKETETDFVFPNPIHRFYFTFQDFLSTLYQKGKMLVNAMKVKFYLCKILRCQHESGCVIAKFTING